MPQNSGCPDGNGGSRPAPAATTDPRRQPQGHAARPPGRPGFLPSDCQTRLPVRKPGTCRERSQKGAQMKAQRVKHPREFRRWLLRHPARRLLVFQRRRGHKPNPETGPQADRPLPRWTQTAAQHEHHMGGVPETPPLGVRCTHANTPCVCVLTLILRTHVHTNAHARTALPPGGPTPGAQWAGGQRGRAEQGSLRCRRPRLLPRPQVPAPRGLPRPSPPGETDPLISPRPACQAGSGAELAGWAAS